MKIDCCIIHLRLWVIHWVCGSLNKQCMPGLVWVNGFSQVDGVSAPAANQVIACETFVSLRQKTTCLFLYFCHQTSGENKLKTVELFQETLNWQHMSDSSGRPIITLHQRPIVILSQHLEFRCRSRPHQLTDEKDRMLQRKKKKKGKERKTKQALAATEKRKWKRLHLGFNHLINGFYD